MSNTLAKIAGGVLLAGSLLFTPISRDSGYLENRVLSTTNQAYAGEFYPADKQRQENIDAFQNDEDRKIMIAGLRAGTVGISLTAAQYVLFAELDWSPSIHRQAEDRLHRIKQKGAVTAHYLIGEETLDESIVETLVEKSLTIDGIMGDEHETEDVGKNRIYLEQLKKKVYKNI